MTDPDAIRAEIRALFLRFEQGDLIRRTFDRLATEHTVKLCRAVVDQALRPGESILAEHHFVHAHLSLNQSVLREPEQVAVSQFVTDTRLLQLVLRLTPGRPVTCDRNDGTEMTEIPLETVRALRIRREIRTSECLAGAVIALAAVLLRDWLQVTGVLLLGLGIAGMIHAIALPTRWLEVVTSPGSAGGGVRIYGLRKKSGRRAVRLLRERIPQTS